MDVFSFMQTVQCWQTAKHYSNRDALVINLDIYFIRINDRIEDIYFIRINDRIELYVQQLRYVDIKNCL